MNIASSSDGQSNLPHNDLPHIEKEIALLRQGYRYVAGLDEAGRGAWAGPVVAAAVILPADNAEITHILAGLDDSKRVTPVERERLFGIIQKTALASAVGMAPAHLVDRLNVVAATRYAMARALAGLNPRPDYLLLDHIRLPAVPLPQDAFPRADSISLSVAAASVMAKVARDRLMVLYDRKYPGYAFDRHKGYGTRAHWLALAERGPCPLHRLSYRPLQIICNGGID